jgi:threonine/homoserine/homoserine lactone efflux protein
MPDQMTLAELSLAILALLITPGPTNTLLALAGAERGMWRAIRLIPAELSGYLMTVVPLMIIGTELIERFPELRPGITAVAALWVLWLSLSILRYRTGAAAAQPIVTARVVFVTTLLNPKALVFGLVILPAETGALWNVANFASQVVIVAVLWTWIGSMLARRSQEGTMRLPEWFRYATAVWLFIVAAGLMVRAVSA